MDELRKKMILLILCSLLLCMQAAAAPGYAGEEVKPVVNASAKPDLVPTLIKPYHYYWAEKSNPFRGSPCFNNSNYVNVTVENTGSGDAESFRIILYADGELIGEKTVDGLAAGSSTDESFDWVPLGEDPLTSWIDSTYGSKLTYTETDRNYTLEAVVDEAAELSEENESNNRLSAVQEVVWNGYTGDEPLQNYLHGTLKGGMLYTTGDGEYLGVGSEGTVYGTYATSSYELEIPGTPVLSRLYIYYNWGKTPTRAPKLGVTFGTPSGTHTLGLDKSYNDYKGELGIYRYPWGTYAYDISEYLTESGSYSISVTNLNDGSDQAFCSEYAFAAPAILTVYENNSMPLKEYWINEGADILLGGRRSDGGYLSYEECMNSALFPGKLSTLGNATLGIVSPWADVAEDDYVWFNGNLLGQGTYRGYNDAVTLEEGPLKMVLGKSSQVSINVSDVSEYLAEGGNTLVQADDGDNMMCTNAFLLADYIELPSLSIRAEPESVTVGVAENVTFTVTSENETVEGAAISLSGPATGSGTTAADGTAIILINATEEGSISATAGKEGFSAANVTLAAETKNGDSSSEVSLEVDIIPEIGLELGSGQLDFGEVSRGSTSPPCLLNFSNGGKKKIKVSIEVSDMDGLFVDGLKLDSLAWENYSGSIAAGNSGSANLTLQIPENYTGLGNQTGRLTFWIEAAE